jgi:heat-inducible transcriptional repressor
MAEKTEKAKASLDDRKSAILRAVVAEYIETAQPVGSGHIAGAEGIDVSSATVRSEMAALEDDGFLAQPHTSAGRVPTDKGYRFFVDQLSGPGVLPSSEAQQVRQFFDRAHGELENLLQDTSRLLAGITDYAAVVVDGTAETATVRSAQMVGLTDHTALVVLVLSNGAVEKRAVDWAGELDESLIDTVTRRLRKALEGVSRSAVPLTVASSGKTDVDGLTAAALAAFAGGGDDDLTDRVYVDGASHVAESFQAVEKVRKVLTILEHQLVVVSLVRDVIDRGLSVAIGAETGVEPLSECSLVLAPIDIGGDEAGTIGLLGPTRMDYEQALAAVALVSKRVSKRLAEG